MTTAGQNPRTNPNAAWQINKALDTLEKKGRLDSLVIVMDVGEDSLVIVMDVGELSSCPSDWSSTLPLLFMPETDSHEILARCSRGSSRATQLNSRGMPTTWRFRV